MLTKSTGPCSALGTVGSADPHNSPGRERSEVGLAGQPGRHRSLSLHPRQSGKRPPLSLQSIRQIAWVEMWDREFGLGIG